MRQVSPRLGYYIVSFGTVLEFLGLVGDSWSGNGSSRILSFSQPGDVLLVIGLAVTVFGTVLGLLSLSHELTHDIARPPRLLPALPLVLLVGFAIGSVAFAYQMSSPSTGGVASAASSATDTSQGALVEATATPQCPPETFWLATTKQCLSLTVDANGNRAVATPVPPGATPVCPAGTIWHPAGNHCLSTSCPQGFVFNTALFVCDLEAGSTPVPAGATPVCPAGTIWHPAGNHCLSTSCPQGYVFNTDLFVCDLEPGSTPALATPGGVLPTPVCPDGTIWHPAGNHCLSTVCPIGYQFDASLFECVQTGGPAPVPTSTPTPLPGDTPTPTPSISPTPTPVPTPVCPDGYFWHPVMGHCMSNTCPPGLVFNYVTLFCELPSTGTPPTTVTPTPTETPTPTPAIEPTPTPVPSPVCPDGYFWHPAMGHCMSDTCPPGLVFNYDTLFCELPPTPTG